MPVLHDSPAYSAHRESRLMICALLGASVQQDEVQKRCREWYDLYVVEASFEISDPLSSLAALYDLPDALDVARYINQAPGPLDAALNVPAAILPYFPDTRLSLEVFRDPEEEMPDTLVVCVWTRLDPASAVKQRARFVDEWLSQYLLDHPEGDIMIGLKFQR